MPQIRAVDDHPRARGCCVLLLRQALTRTASSRRLTTAFAPSCKQRESGAAAQAQSRPADLTRTFLELHRWILYRGPSSYRVILALVKPERKFPRQAQCGCGAVVAHHLAKVRVASSNLVIRSSVTQSGGKHQKEFARVSTHNTVTWPRGEAAACKAVHTGSNPVVTSQWAIGAAVARFPDTEEVTGSIPVSPTIEEKAPEKSGAFFASRRSPDRKA
ncbi:conserved hypothetical protein [Pseudoclavibacter sp. 8L]|nr:conserved hypothetical protein [Pseudoclavibacter sp. 8L]